MAVFAQSIWLLALAGAALLSARAVCVWAARHDLLATAFAGGLTGLACVSLAAVYTSAGW